MGSDYISKNLGNGVAPTTKTTVYTVGVGKSAIVRSITLANKLGSAVVVNIWANFGSGSRHIAPVNMSMDAGFFFEHDISITMDAGDSIEMEAASPNAIDFVISGVEST